MLQSIICLVLLLLLRAVTTAAEHYYLALFHRHNDDAAASLAFALTAGITLVRTLDDTLGMPGFAFSVDKHNDTAVLQQLRDHPSIRTILPDTRVYASRDSQNQTADDLSWGLDRLDGSLNGVFEYPANPGRGVDVYIVDTGINVYHDDFAGRIAPDDEHFNMISTADDVETEDPPYWDCDGHGSHVASTAGGTVFGVAKAAILHAVRVLDCDGAGFVSGVVAGLGQVARQCARKDQACVVNLSLSSSGSPNEALNAAVDALVDQYGIVVVASAGNDNQDACLVSPASAERAITVGSTTALDQRSAFSNFGSCVDMFGPGSLIIGAWHSCTDCTNTISGTSMAAPHVTGVAALIVQDLMAQGVTVSPDLVRYHLIHDALPGILGNLDDDESPNLLLQINTPFVSLAPSTAPTDTTQPSLTPTLLECGDHQQDKVEIRVQTDGFASQTAFHLKNVCLEDDEQELWASSTSLENSMTYSYIACVGFGRFVFNITDSAGDGLFFPGHYQVVYQEQEIAYGFFFQQQETVVFGDDDCVTNAPTMSHPPSLSPTITAAPTGSAVPTSRPTTPLPSATPSRPPTTLPSAMPSRYSCPNDDDRYVLVEVYTDGWGYEVSLDLRDECDERNVLSVPLFALENDQLYQWKRCVEEHQHTFTIRDLVHDGLMAPGYVRLYLDGELLLDDPNHQSTFTFTFFPTDGCGPTTSPTPIPSLLPSSNPTVLPSSLPSTAPSWAPTTVWSQSPTTDAPSQLPSEAPPSCPEVLLTIHIETDADAHEIAFRVDNVCTGETVMAMDHYALEDLEYYVFHQCISFEHHRLTVLDSFGDGFADPGSIRAYWNGARILDNPDFDKTHTMNFGSDCPAAEPDSCPCDQRLRVARLLCQIRNPFACFLP